MKKNKTILALGADIKNKFLLAKGKEFFFGPDIGNLSEAKNFDRFKSEISRALRKIGKKPDIIACDLHPGYFSTQFAETQSPRLVQHHHAHIASVIEEHGLAGPVIGVSFDGTGFGTDGNVWGGEFLIVDEKGFKRVAHLKYRRMPGSDMVVREPWRMVLSILGEKALPFIKSVKGRDKRAILSMCEKNINSPLTSSAGRLFDAAAALTGICEYASYEAEGPIKLEAMCDGGVSENYEFDMLKDDRCYIIDTEPVFSAVAGDLNRGRDKGVIAAKFHNSMVNVIVTTVTRLSGRTGIKKVALSGGVFQNRFLRKRVIKKLSPKFNIFINEKLPVNDLNISLGQYYVSGRTGKG